MDLTFTFVRALQLIGLAWDVVPVKVAAYKQKDDAPPADTPAA